MESKASNQFSPTHQVISCLSPRNTDLNNEKDPEISKNAFFDSISNNNVATATNNVKHRWSTNNARRPHTTSHAQTIAASARNHSTSYFEGVAAKATSDESFWNDIQQLSIEVKDELRYQCRKLQKAWLSPSVGQQQQCGGDLLDWTESEEPEKNLYDRGNRARRSNRGGTSNDDIPNHAEFFTFEKFEQLLSCVPLSVDPRSPNSRARDTALEKSKNEILMNRADKNRTKMRQNKNQTSDEKATEIKHVVDVNNVTGHCNHSGSSNGSDIGEDIFDFSQELSASNNRSRKMKHHPVVVGTIQNRPHTTPARMLLRHQQIYHCGQFEEVEESHIINRSSLDENDLNESSSPQKAFVLSKILVNNDTNTYSQTMPKSSVEEEEKTGGHAIVGELWSTSLNQEGMRDDEDSHTKNNDYITQRKGLGQNLSRIYNSDKGISQRNGERYWTTKNVSLESKHSHYNSDDVLMMRSDSVEEKRQCADVSSDATIANHVPFQHIEEQRDLANSKTSEDDEYYVKIMENAFREASESLEREDNLRDKETRTRRHKSRIRPIHGDAVESRDDDDAEGTSLEMSAVPGETCPRTLSSIEKTMSNDERYDEREGAILEEVDSNDGKAEKGFVTNKFPDRIRSIAIGTSRSHFQMEIDSSVALSAEEQKEKETQGRNQHQEADNEEINRHFDNLISSFELSVNPHEKKDRNKDAYEKQKKYRLQRHLSYHRKNYFKGNEEATIDASSLVSHINIDDEISSKVSLLSNQSNASHFLDGTTMGKKLNRATITHSSAQNENESIIIRAKRALSKVNKTIESVEVQNEERDEGSCNSEISSGHEGENDEGLSKQKSSIILHTAHPIALRKKNLLLHRSSRYDNRDDAITIKEAEDILGQRNALNNEEDFVEDLRFDDVKQNSIECSEVMTSYKAMGSVQIKETDGEGHTLEKEVDTKACSYEWESDRGFSNELSTEVVIQDTRHPIALKKKGLLIHRNSRNENRCLPTTAIADEEVSVHRMNLDSAEALVKLQDEEDSFKEICDDKARKKDISSSVVSSLHADFCLDAFLHNYEGNDGTNKGICSLSANSFESSINWDALAYSMSENISIHGEIDCGDQKFNEPRSLVDSTDILAMTIQEPTQLEKSRLEQKITSKLSLDEEHSLDDQEPGRILPRVKNQLLPGKINSLRKNNSLPLSTISPHHNMSRNIPSFDKTTDVHQVEKIKNNFEEMINIPQKSLSSCHSSESNSSMYEQGRSIVHYESDGKNHSFSAIPLKKPGMELRIERAMVLKEKKEHMEEPRKYEMEVDVSNEKSDVLKRIKLMKQQNEKNLTVISENKDVELTNCSIKETRKSEMEVINHTIDESDEKSDVLKRIKLMKQQHGKNVSVSEKKNAELTNYSIHGTGEKSNAPERIELIKRQQRVNMEVMTDSIQTDDKRIAECVGLWQLNTKRFQKAKNEWENNPALSNPSNGEISSINLQRSLNPIVDMLDTKISSPRFNSVERLMSKNLELEKEMQRIKMMSPKSLNSNLTVKTVATRPGINDHDGKSAKMLSPNDYEQRFLMISHFKADKSGSVQNNNLLN